MRRCLMYRFLVAMLCAVVLLLPSLGRAQNMMVHNNDKGIRQVIDSYFTTRMESLKAGRVLGAYRRLFDPQSQAAKRYHEGLLLLDIVARTYHGHLVEWFSYTPLYRSVVVDDTIAKAVLEPRITFKDGNRDDLFATGAEVHTIILAKTPSGWLIQDDLYSNETTSAYPRGTNFGLEINRFYVDTESARQNPGPRFLDPLAQERYEREQDGISILTDAYRSYNGSNGASYARAHTRDGSRCATTDWNNHFVWFGPSSTPECRDCQNFVSQCVWRGFGGVDTSTAIENHGTPMVDNWPGTTTEWWADSIDWVTTWTVSSSFMTMVTDNYKYNRYGVQGALLTSIDYVEVGDVVRIKSGGHAMYVTIASDTDGDGHLGVDEVAVTAHTNNREDRPLDFVVEGASPSMFNFIEIRRLKYIIGFEP